MNISSALFHISAPDLTSCPDESLPEFAFIGRSNVGKSSLLNMLSGKPNLAKVSPTPGYTKLINIFTMNKTWRLVDLPGYGFAQVARKDMAKFNEAVADYLKNRPNLRGVFVLLDSSLPPQKLDLEFLQWLAGISAPIVLVFTKIDKTSPTNVQTNVEAFKAHLSGWCEQLPEIFTCSSVTKQGRGDLLGAIGKTLAQEPRNTGSTPKIAVRRPEPPSMERRRAPWNRLLGR
ncbi:MAG: YihA family ribosome biogenesis GTP-binding protein [Pedosphaera sp.]|nr:YihA family ribosome biogenesis GTP-binding protein [Pedosphaera sp.]